MLGEIKTFADTGFVEAEEVAFAESRAGFTTTAAASFFASGQTAATEELLSFHQTSPPIKKMTEIAPIAITAISSELRPPSAVGTDDGAGVDGTDDGAGVDGTVPGDADRTVKLVKLSTPDTPGTFPRINDSTATELKSAGRAADSEEVTAVANICGSPDTMKPAVMAATAEEKFTLLLTATNGPESV